MRRLPQVLLRFVMVAVLGLSACNGSPVNPSAALNSLDRSALDQPPDDEPTGEPAASTRAAPEAGTRVGSDVTAGVPTGTAYDASIDAQCRAGLDNPVIRDMLESRIAIAGDWTGSRSSHWVTRLMVKKDTPSPDQYRLTFVLRTDIMDSDYERTAKFENGVLKLDEPVSRLELVGSSAPYSVLFAVRTGHGDFLVPSVNAEAIKSIDDLRPGLAYRRRTDQ